MKISFQPANAQYLGASLAPGHFVMVSVRCGKDECAHRALFQIDAFTPDGDVIARYSQNATLRVPNGSKLTTRRRFHIPRSAILRCIDQDAFDAAYSATVRIPEPFATLSANQRRIVAHVVCRMLGEAIDLGHPADVCRALDAAGITEASVSEAETWVCVESAARDLLCSDVASLVPSDDVLDHRAYSPPSDECSSDRLYLFVQTPQCAVKLNASFGSYSDEEHDGYATAWFSFAASPAHAAQTGQFRRSVIDEAIADAVTALRALQPSDMPTAVQSLAAVLVGAES